MNSLNDWVDKTYFKPTHWAYSSTWSINDAAEDAFRKSSGVTDGKMFAGVLAVSGSRYGLIFNKYNDARWGAGILLTHSDIRMFKMYDNVISWKSIY